MPRKTFKVVEAFNIKGHGVVVVGDKACSDFLEIKACDIEIIMPNGDVLKDVCFKECSSVRRHLSRMRPMHFLSEAEQNLKFR
jgi:hypothetical protein